MSEAVARSARSMLAMDAVRREDEVVVYIDCPGVPADEIDVSVERNELTVKMERRWDDDAEQVLINERPQGTFSRRLVVSEALDVEALMAKLEDGVLTISIPVAERSKPRRVEIKGRPSSAAIETGPADDDAAG